LALAQHPDLDIERNRSSPKALDVGVAADGVADMHRLQKGDVRHRYGYHPSAGMRCRRHLAGRIHQTHDPAAENIALRVAVGRHGQGAGSELALRFSRIALLALVTHRSISRGLRADGPML